ERPQRGAKVLKISLQAARRPARLTHFSKAVPSPFLPLPIRSIRWGEGRGEGSAAGISPCSIEIKQPGMLEQCFLLDSTTISPPNQQSFDPLDRFARAVMNFDHDLIDLRPVAVVDALNDVQFAFLCINLEEVNLVDLILPDNVRHRCQPALVITAKEPVSGEFVDVFLHRIARD